MQETAVDSEMRQLKPLATIAKGTTHEKSYAIEAMGTQYGVVRTKVEGRGWQGWCKIPYIQYDE